MPLARLPAPGRRRLESDLILARDAHLFWGILAVIVAAFVTNLLLGQFNPGFEGQPVAHTNNLWNFGGMVLAGLAFTLAATSRVEMADLRSMAVRT